MSFEIVAAPPRASATAGLFAHQRAGAEWLAQRPAAYLADPPGLGKTRTILEAALLADARTTLVVCPAIVRPHWRAEAETMGVRGVSVMSYEEARREYAQPNDTRYELVVFDEAHYLKTPTAQRTKILLDPKRSPMRGAGHVWFASGTPIVKHAGDLWPVLSRAFPAMMAREGFHTRTAWEGTFCEQEYNIWSKSVVPVPGVVKDAGRLQDVLRGLMLRREYHEVAIDLPELRWTVLRIEGQQIIVDVPEALLGWAEGTAELRLNDPHLARYRHNVGDAKAVAAGRMIAEEAVDEPQVVFAYHRSVLQALTATMVEAGLLYSYVDGDTSPADRQTEIERFQRGETRVFIGQQTACETGITLTAARRVTLLEPSWTAQNNVQAGRRVARIGQQHAGCEVRMIALAGTLDEAVVARHRREAQMFDNVMSNRQDLEAVA